MVYEDEILYNRYQQRLNLRKRTQTGNDPSANYEIQSRPAKLTIDLAPPPETSVEDELFGADSDDNDEKALFGLKRTRVSRSQTRMGREDS